MVSDAVDDADLIRAARGGDAEAAAQWVRRNWDGLYRYVLRVVRDVHLAEDITQETLLRALRRVHRLDLSRPLRPWLLRVATNLAIDEKRRPATLELDAAPEPTAAGGAKDTEAHDALEAALKEIPAAQRSALVLRVCEQWAYGQIAQAIGCSETTARWHVHQAKQSLRKRLKDHG